MSYASITVVGRLARDAETRMTSTGKQIVSGSVAVGTGDKTQWYKVQGWEKSGDWLKDAKKGDLVYAQGTLTIGTYEKRTGGTAIEAVVNAQIIRTSAKRDTSGEDFGASAPRQAQIADLDFDQDVPF